jgi:hypothetical protein
MNRWMISSLLLLVTTIVNGYPVDSEGKAIIPEPIKQRCIAKGEVALFVYKHRDMLTLEQVLETLEEDWESAWSKNPNIPWATRVDMERIVRDAYRTDSNNEYIRECCTEEVAEQQSVTEMRECVYWLEY